MYVRSSGRLKSYSAWLVVFVYIGGNHKKRSIIQMINKKQKISIKNYVLVWLGFLLVTIISPVIIGGDI